MNTSALQEIETAATRRKWLRYPRYQATGIPWLGSVPDHWKIVRLRWTIESARNGVWGSEPDGDNDIPCVRVADFDRVAFRVGDNIPTQRSVTPSERRGRVLNRGDLLLEKSGGGELQPVGAVAIFDSKLSAICSNFLARLVPASNCDSRYLSYLHAQLYSARINLRSIKQTTGIQNLDAYSYFCERVPSPPLDEQRAIAAFLDRETTRIDELIAKKQRLIELLKEKRQAVISRAVTKGLDPNAAMKPSGIDWLGDVPAHWEIKRIGFLTTSQGGCTPSKDNSAFWNGDIPWVTPKDMKTDVISDSTDHVTEDALQNTGLKQIPNPVVLIVVRGMILAHTFPVALTQAPVTINQDMKALTPANNLYAEFLSCLLRACSPAFFAIVEESGHGTRVLRTDLWSKQELPIPPVEEQKEIAGFVARTTEQFDQLANKVKRAMDRLSAYRSALITAAVTGQIDVRNYQAEAIS